MYRKLLPLACIILATTSADAQKLLEKTISVSEVDRIERTLSADDMKGRRPNTPGIDKAADFIAAEFKKAGLQPVKGDSYFQDFNMLRTKFIDASGTLNGQPLDKKFIVGITSAPGLKVTETSGYQVLKADKDSVQAVVARLQKGAGNYLLVIDTAGTKGFNALKYKSGGFESKANIIAILTTETPATYSFDFQQEVTAIPYKNVVGILPGKSKKEEIVIFSGHYDHLGTAKKANEQGDSIYNGANDDAAGTTAVIMLAEYFSKVKNNERTIVFAAFTAEESGGFGSQYFSRQFDPVKVMAMFNIEMIGTESKWGTNSAYITGYEKTSMGDILAKNLKGTGFTFYPDPYPQQSLFYRSDNATLARLGVPAHTISTSKMDSEKFYHTLDDEIETLDMKNMAEIIKAIAISSTSIIAGKDTPSRVDAGSLR